jgi:predicted NAD/FAD-dependent oxidoreductase
MNIVVIGAGIAGITCARGLVQQGHSVVVVDKGRSPGGRMATRRDGDATFDHGAQFFTVRHDTFHLQVQDWLARGLVHEWFRSEPIDGDESTSHPRFVATAGMNTLVKDLASDLDVRCSVTVSSVVPNGTGWTLHTLESGSLDCDALVVTSPIPQTLQLLSDSNVVIPEQIQQCVYDPTVVLLVVLDKKSSALPKHGCIQNPDDIFSFIADNESKKVSRVPALTFHANARWSSQHFEESDELLHEQLLSAARNWCGDAQIVSSQVKKWRYATPHSAWPNECWVNEESTLVLAGDAFHANSTQHAKIESAYLSGYAAVIALT